MRSATPLSTHDLITKLQARFPEALICTVCSRLVATSKKSYEKSGLTEEARLSYVCSECRMDEVERKRTGAKLKALKPRAQLRRPIVVLVPAPEHTIELGAQNRTKTYGRYGAESLDLLNRADAQAVQAPVSDASDSTLDRGHRVSSTPLISPAVYAGPRGGFSSTRSPRPGGRPRKYRTGAEQRRAAVRRQQQYRTRRQTLAQVPA